MQKQNAEVVNKEIYRLQPEDLGAARNNEATTEFQARTIELRSQRPQWITYYQLLLLYNFLIWSFSKKHSQTKESNDR